jgi:predicted CoA-substrate-specific enzyme activase
MVHYIGIDVGSTCTKAVALDKNKDLVFYKVLPTGWSCLETADNLLKDMAEVGVNQDDSRIVATGYGRVSIPYADKTVTEISCHGQGAAWLFNMEDFTAIDIGGQDTKIIEVKSGQVNNFIMNDKCSAGTGRFLDIMAGTLGVSLEELSELARNSKKHMSISSMCTVFAESEVVSLIGRGEKKEDIAYAILDSITTKVRGQMGKLALSAKEVVLTGGLCEIPFIREMLSQKISTTIESDPLARYAGAIGASLYAVKLN